MTRSYAFVLPSSIVAYNLWSLIAATLTIPASPTFADEPYTPDRVCALQIFMPIAGTHAAANSGNNISIQDAVSGQELRNLIPGDIAFSVFSDRNVIDLKCYSLQGSASGGQGDVSNVVAEVTITAN